MTRDGLVGDRAGRIKSDNLSDCGQGPEVGMESLVSTIMDGSNDPNERGEMAGQHDVWRAAGAPHGLPAGLFLEVVEQSSIAISITDPRAHIVFSNPAFSQLTGYSRGELRGRNHNVLASQQTPRSRYQAMWQALGELRPWSGRLINRRKDGSVYLAEVTVTPVLDGRGELSHYLGMHKDISDLFVLEQRLKNQMGLLEAVLNAAPMAVAVLNDNEQVVLDNLAYKTLRTDLQGAEPWLQLRQIRAQEEDGSPYRPLSVRGAQRWYSLTRMPIESLSEEVVHYFGQGRRTYSLLLIQDCTAAHQQQQQQYLTHLRLQLEERRLLLSIHESLEAAALRLRGPINLLQAAQRLEPDGAHIPALRLAQEEAERAWQWLLDRRPQSVVEPLQPVVVRHLLGDLAALFEAQRPAGVQVNFLLPESELLVRAQPLRLMLALWQLLELLVRRLPAGAGALRLSTLCEAHGVCLLLEDDGPCPEDLAHCHSLPFNCLWQQNEGAELGLSLVQEIINEHNGLIAVQASELGGALIHLELPLLLDDRRS